MTILARMIMAALVAAFLCRAADAQVTSIAAQDPSGVDVLLQADADKNLKVSPQVPTYASGYGITPVVSASAEANKVLKNAPGNLYGFSVTTGASAGYVMLYNATAAPSDGAVTPIKCYYVPATSSLAASFDVPIAFSTGITIGFSTTGCFTKTASATAFFSGEVK